VAEEGLFRWETRHTYGGRYAAQCRDDEEGAIVDELAGQPELLAALLKWLVWLACGLADECLST